MATIRHNDYQLESGRFAELDWTAYADEDETAIALDAGDDVHWRLAASEGGESLIELSRTPNLSGSKVVVDELGDTSDPDEANWVTARGRVLIYPADTALAVVTKPTFYFDELLLEDAADGDALKTICRGRVQVRPSQT